MTDDEEAIQEVVNLLKGLSSRVEELDERAFAVLEILSVVATDIETLRRRMDVVESTLDLAYEAARDEHCTKTIEP